MVRFSFTGKLEAKTDISSNGYFYRHGKTKDTKKDGKIVPGKDYSSVNFQVVQEKNNRAFVEMFGMKSSTIKTMDTDFKAIEIDWDERDDEDVKKSVANVKKNTIKIDDDRNDFIASYDAVEYIKDHINELNGKIVTITGQRSKNVYNGKISNRFQLSNIYTVDDEDSPKKLQVTMELFFNKESIDTADWADEKKLYINGYTEEYISDVKENRYVPQQIVFDCSKIDFKNEKHVKAVSFRLKMFGCELNGDKIVCKLKGKNMFQMGLITNYVNGSEKVEFTEDMLTPVQKEALELGLKTLDDFRPAGSVYGERVITYKLRDFDMRAEGKYAEGYIDTEIATDEFEEKIFSSEEPEKASEVLEAENDSNEEDEDDLFG